MASLLPGITGTLPLYQVSNSRKSVLLTKVPGTSGDTHPKLIISHESTCAITTFYIKKKNQNKKPQLSKLLSISSASHSKPSRLPEGS